MPIAWDMVQKVPTAGSATLSCDGRGVRRRRAVHLKCGWRNDRHVVCLLTATILWADKRSSIQALVPGNVSTNL
jgi:hypothetical protein